MKRRRPPQPKADGKAARPKSNVEQFAEILRIVSSRSPDDHGAVACFLLNATTRLGGRSPVEIISEGKPAMMAKVRQLAIESLE